MSTSNTGAAVSRMVRPIISQDLVEAKLNVLKMYKQFQRVAKQHWWDYNIPLPVFREVLKKEFMKNAHIQDVRIIDRQVEELDEFKEKLVEKAVEKEGPGDTEPEEEEVAENHEGPEQPSGEATENSKETKEEEGEDGPKEHLKEEKEGEEEGPKHEESGETHTKETEEEQKEPKIEEDGGKENEEGPKIKEKKKKPGKAEKKEKSEKKKEKTKKDTKEASKGKISKEPAKENEGINSHSNSEDSSASSEGQFEDGPDIVKRPPVGSEELPMEPEENSDESGPKLVEESESDESPEDEYERRSKEREQLKHGYSSNFCKKYIHRCYIEEYMTEMTTHCKDICDLLGTLNVDIGLNCEELALSGLCSDGMWGDKMDKYCHRSCTSLRGKR
uniref:Complex 1 LYR protein domain-containing protein n=1 Tax=Meloidogyne javanica TaxID=6303 RepID=A0A915MD64_MELJA